MEPTSFEGRTDTEIVQTMQGWAREDGTAAGAAELQQLKSMMSDKSSAYWKGPEAERNQARYRELLTDGPLSKDPDTRLSQVMTSNAQAEEQAEAERLHLSAHPYQLPKELADDELAASFASMAGAASLSPDLVHDVLSSKSHGGFLDRDDSDRDAGVAELRQVWGTAYEANLQRVRAYVRSNLPPHLSEALMAPARRADGRALVNDPSFLVQLFGMAKRGAQLTTGDAAEIRRLMGTRAYTADPAVQVRYQYLTRQQRKGGR